jgi:hypothetical protein
MIFEETAMPTNNGYALLIGVDDYSTYDRSMGNPGNTSDLLGSRHDAVLFYWLCRRLFGLPPSNIKILTSPSLSQAELEYSDAPPENLGEATEGSIRSGVDWLVQQMNGGTVQGLLTFSGHGAWVEDKGAVICPADVREAFTGAITVRDLRSAVERGKARKALTVVLDCSHAAPQRYAVAPLDLRRNTALPHGGSAEDVATDDQAFNMSDRTLLAARPGKHAYQAQLGRGFHGALSFSLVTVAEQWRATQEAVSGQYDVSYKRLFRRVKDVFKALEMGQKPELRASKAIRKVPFFALEGKKKARKSDAARRSAALDEAPTGVRAEDRPEELGVPPSREPEQ